MIWAGRIYFLEEDMTTIAGINSSLEVSPRGL